MALSTFINREIVPRNYLHLCGSEKERRLARFPPPAVDKIIEMRSPRGKRDFNPLDYRALYLHCFQNPDEQTPWGDMTNSIYEMARIDAGIEASAFLRKKYGLLRYHDVVALSGKLVVGFTSFATMPLDGENAIVYSLYSGVADSEFARERYGGCGGFRRQGIATLFCLLRHGMAEEDAGKLGYAKDVAGTMMEAEFIGQANDARGMRKTRTNLQIHQRLGALALMIETSGGEWITPCVQPELSRGSNPLLLHLLFREREIRAGCHGQISEMDRSRATDILKAYACNYEWQSTEAEIERMRSGMDARLRAAKRFILVPYGHLPDITALARMDPMLREQVERDYGPLEKHAQRIREALG